MLHSVIKSATVLGALGVSLAMAQPAEAQWGRWDYGHRDRYAPSHHYYGGAGYGYGGYGAGYDSWGGYAPGVGAGSLHGGSEYQFIESLYRNLLGREPEPFEVQGWVQGMQLNNMSRAQVIHHFRNSREFLGRQGGGGYWGAGQPYSYGYQGGYGW